MVNRNAACFVETGNQLRAIREDLRMTLDAVSKETGISRSYISDFERGFRLPTSKYLRYLQDRHQVNLNYVFGSEERKFRNQKNKLPHFINTLHNALKKTKFSRLESFKHHEPALMGCGRRPLW